jgi:hypothetical protein
MEGAPSLARCRGGRIPPLCTHSMPVGCRGGSRPASRDRPGPDAGAGRGGSGGRRASERYTLSHGDSTLLPRYGVIVLRRSTLPVESEANPMLSSKLAKRTSVAPEVRWGPSTRTPAPVSWL